MSISLPFSPVPRQAARHDGWSADCQRQFIAALCDYGVVRAAAAKVGKGHACAYRLRRAPGAQSFAAAWDEALAIGMAQLQDVAMDRALHGIAIPQFYKGEQVGETRWYDNRLLMFMLRQTNTRRFGTHAAEHDFVDEIQRVEAEQDDKRRDLIARTEAMIAQFDAIIAEHAAHGTPVPDELEDKRERLSDYLDQLRQPDTLRAEEENLNRLQKEGRLSARNVRHFRKQLGLGP
jgi:hypothetical protein